jgi:hypothetical protein
MAYMRKCENGMVTPPSTPSFVFWLKANNSVATSPKQGRSTLDLEVGGNL